MNEMTDEQINQAVAECCGWREAFPQHKSPHPETRKGGILLPYKWVNENTHARALTIPSYTASRDAMAGALETLSEEEWAEFAGNLCAELCAYAFPQDFSHLAALFKATPKQLAIAFLKAKGKL